jgi:hypothetical protein
MGNAPFAFYGVTATVTTTASQRVTAVVTGYGQTGAGLVASTQFGLCSRPAGTSSAPTRFETPMSPNFAHVTENPTTFTAAESAVLGAGMWEVGLCGTIAGGNTVQGSSAGWVMVTN